MVQEGFLLDRPEFDGDTARMNGGTTARELLFGDGGLLLWPASMAIQTTRS